MDMRHIPPKQGTSPTCNPLTLSWDTPCCTHISDKKLCSFPAPRVDFFASDTEQQQQQQRTKALFS